ncbi:MAG TPA: hypothetical protein VGO57_15260 [Verrucomicrobiae bacterium]
MEILKAIERGVAAAKQTYQPKKYQAAGRPVLCSHCTGDSFEMPPGIIGTFSGYVLQCCQCGHLECFGKEPTEIK